jgi:erythromycin esterase
VWRLAGTSPQLADGDLAPLRKLIGPARVVGLGESVHTAGGFYETKHRLFRHLVEDLGFRAFLIESNWSAADRVAQYVRTCGEDPAEALRGVYGVWQSEETRALVEWMCEWNRGHPRARDRLHFAGFDVQQPRVDEPALAEFLLAIGVPADDPMLAGIERCDDQQTPPVHDDAEGDHAACVVALDAIERKLDRERRAIVRRTSRQALAWARVRLVGLQSWEDAYYYRDTDSARAFAARDAGMAYVLQAMRELRLPKGAKVAVWAHNRHIAKGPVMGIPTMGSFLAGVLRNQYTAVALTAPQVDIDWPGIGCGPIPDSPPDSVEGKLRGLGEETLLVDPRRARVAIEPGPVNNFNDWPDADPARLFGAVVYLDFAPAMTPLHRPPCR